jgi:hypothetical protein
MAWISLDASEPLNSNSPTHTATHGAHFVSRTSGHRN